jgi:hypothetical protein
MLYAIKGRIVYVDAPEKYILPRRGMVKPFPFKFVLIRCHAEPVEASPLLNLDPSTGSG